ncbi:hypothetical protein ARAM_005939 [Aspergillus rambellii]|uniref:TeaA receptor TeaR n=1 Tax=Aspergillus rambellii TaxID=308745 RepID=A0A0F8VSH3_9EURO|nr:hypothetical protein ARAM_005939 [Aspergillus rambellii]
MAGTATAAFSSDVWTSSSSLEASQQQWEFSVPIRQESNRRRRSKSRSRSSRDAKSRDRGSKGSRSSSMSRHAHAHEQVHYSSRGHRDASLNRYESETGSGRDPGITPHMNGSAKKAEENEGIGLYLKETDNENWIHRDKLAKIESEELHQILLQRRPGTGSIKAGHGRSRDQHGSVSGSVVTTPQTTEPLEPWPDLQEEQRNHPDFLAPEGQLNGHGTGEERRHWDLRRPEEIAAEIDGPASNVYHNPGLRKSSSRIPIPTMSPAPLSPEHLDRELPMQRTRALTGEEDPLSFGMPRRASEPITVDSASTSSPASDSRPGSRGVQTSQTTLSKKTAAKPGSTSRKASAPPTTRKATPRNRATSSNTTQRPTTRSGETRPPTAVNRPEGDPPWLATMYKPDPRLPPDQQILPTHARRMQQEQWAKEGKTPTTYDREFAPLAIAPDPTQVRDKAKKEEEKEENKEKPPESLKIEGLGLSAIPKSPEPGTRPSTGTGYSPMPKVQETPPVGLTPKWNTQTVVTAQSPPDEKADKGCGCCIVM